MPPSITPGQVLLDLSACMGLGFLAGVLRCLASLRRRGIGFWADFVCGVAVPLALQGYAAGRSSAGCLRWYMLAAAAAGAFSALSLLAPVRVRLCRALQAPARQVCRSAQSMQRRARQKHKKRRAERKKSRRAAKKSAKSQKKQLPSRGNLLYNSTI